MSYANFIMLHATIPVYETDDEKATKKEEKIDGFESLESFLNG